MCLPIRRWTILGNRRPPWTATKKEGRMATSTYARRPGWVTFAAVLMFAVAFVRIDIRLGAGELR
jgi:hypothetical protein